MTNCCIKTCGARKNKNLPTLSFHRFPKKDKLRKLWLKAIGEENINPLHMSWFVCSLHFEDSCFNRTLDETRLRDDSLPTLFLRVNEEQYKVLIVCETSKIFDHSYASVDPLETLRTNEEEHKMVNVLPITSNTILNHPSMSTVEPKPVNPVDQFMTLTESIKHIKKIQVLTEKCLKQMKIIKALKERNRRILKK